MSEAPEEAVTETIAGSGLGEHIEAALVEHNERLAEAEPDQRRPLIVAVSGSDSSQTAALAKTAAEHLESAGQSTARVSLDGFVLAPAVLARRGVEAGDLESYDIPGFVSTIMRVFAVRFADDEIWVPQYSPKITAGVHGSAVIDAETQVVIFDGLWVGHVFSDLAAELEYWPVDEILHVVSAEGEQTDIDEFVVGNEVADTLIEG